jgi:hypothetical protein
VFIIYNNDGDNASTPLTLREHPVLIRVLEEDNCVASF